MRKSARSYAGLSLVVGLVSIAIGGGYWYWDYQRQKRIDGEKKTPPAPPMAVPAPRAQTLPVAAPTHDLILSVQHALNSVFGWHPGDPHFLSEDGSATLRFNSGQGRFSLRIGCFSLWVFLLFGRRKIERSNGLKGPEVDRIIEQRRKTDSCN